MMGAKLARAAFSAASSLEAATVARAAAAFNVTCDTATQSKGVVQAAKLIFGTI